MSIELVENFKKCAIEGGFKEANVDRILSCVFEEITTRLDRVPSHRKGIEEALIERGIEYGLNEKQSKVMAKHFFNNEYIKEELEEAMAGLVATSNDYDNYLVHEWIRNSIESYIRVYVKNLEKGLKEGIEKVAKSLLLDGMPLPIISKHTGLSQAELEIISAEIKENMNDISICKETD